MTYLSLATEMLGHFYLEKVGQYFKDAQLSQPPDNRGNPWCDLLAARPELAKIPFILPANTNTSIVQEKDRLLQVGSVQVSQLLLCVEFPLKQNRIEF